MRVLLVPNTGNPRSVQAVRELAVWLVSGGWESVLVSEDAEAVGLPEHGVPRTGIGVPALAVALGGDGTILKAVHLSESADTPVLGVNLGRLGFMSGADAASMREAITDALAGDVRVERRATLQAEVSMAGRTMGRFRALNEVFVGRGPTGRVVDVAVSVNGSPLVRFLADGVVVATPTGSTAYALSAGGPVLAPDVGGTVVVPVAAHTLRSRPLVIGPSDRVEIAFPNPLRANACVSVDGEAMPCRQALERVAVWRGERDVALVKHDGRGFYDVLRDEFLGG
ncbi:MAG: NAD(+)/NADH kinase [Coriobacteriia bacterium]|nr:NAD(+)/NADH kinase [Coriobacteriia bacterium]